MRNEVKPARRTRRSFLKKSAMAGVGAQSALIFSGLVMTSHASGSDCEGEVLTYQNYEYTEVATEDWTEYEIPDKNGTTWYITSRSILPASPTYDPPLSTGWTAPSNGTGNCPYEKDGSPKEHVKPLTNAQRLGSDGLWHNTNKNVTEKALNTIPGSWIEVQTDQKTIRRTWAKQMFQTWKCKPTPLPAA